MTTNTDTDIIRRHFDLAPAADTDAYVALFAPDAVVEDEEEIRHGLDEIRAWRSEVPTVRYDVTFIAATDSGHDAMVEIAGDFPGSPVDLRFGFDIADDGLIHGLAIGTP